MVLGPLALLGGLLAGESALAACGYLLAYALFIDQRERRSRLASLIPYASVAIVWLVTYSRLGYGAWGSGFYVDALSEPLRFVGAVAWKGPILLADQLGLPPSFLVLFLPREVITGLLIWSLVLLAVIGFFFAPLLRHSQRARFWAMGMLLSIPLVCSTMPHSRLLTFAGIGAFGLLAEWIGGIREKAGWLPAGRGWRGGARGMLLFFLLVHLFLAPLLLPFNATSAAFAQKYIQTPADELAAGPELAGQDLVIVNHPIVFYGHYLSTARLLAGRPYPRHLRVLAPATGPVEVFRPDERSLLLRPERGFLGEGFDNVFRGESHPLRLGERVWLTGMEVEIRELTRDGRPAAALFRFDVPLTDPSLRWVRWEEAGYAPFPLPGVGEGVTLPAAPPLF
jgi:hypothetical protein